MPVPNALQRQRPARRRRPRTGRARPRLRWRAWLAIGLPAFVLLLLVWAILERHFAPVTNTTLQHFDAIIVLGTPADADGNPTPEQIARVAEGVREYEHGVAPRLLFTGGAAHNRFVEAQAMARVAQSRGVPAANILIEPQAMDTIQNACYATRILRARGWGSAEVVSAASHLPRAGLIFSHLPLRFRTHAAPPLAAESPVYSAAVSTLETLKTVRYLVWARPTEHCEP